MVLQKLEEICRQFLESELESMQDVSHDIDHIIRVVQNVKRILQTERADVEVVIAGAWLHDCVIIPKDHPDRKQASIQAADKAEEFLGVTDFPSDKISKVKHVIAAHSYSSGMKAESIEAKIVQDADRLDALGAIGIARCLMVGGDLDRPLYKIEDPFCEHGEPDDSRYTLDHFYEKLFKLPDLMHTNAAKKEAVHRVDFMKEYINQLREEITYSL